MLTPQQVQDSRAKLGLPNGATVHPSIANGPTGDALLQSLHGVNQPPQVAVQDSQPVDDRNGLQKFFGTFLDAPIRKAVQTGQAVGDLALTGVNELSKVGNNIATAIDGGAAADRITAANQKSSDADLHYIQTLFKGRKDALAKGTDTSHYDTQIKNFEVSKGTKLSDLYPNLVKNVGVIDKLTPEGDLSSALQRAENTSTKVPVFGTKTQNAKDITLENTVGDALQTVALGAGSPAAAGAAIAAGSALSQDKGAADVALNAVVGALGGKILEYGFNAVAPYIEKAAVKYGTPIIEKLSGLVPDSAKGFMETLSSKIPNIAEKKVLPTGVSDVINKTNQAVSKVVDAPFNAVENSASKVANSVRNASSKTVSNIKEGFSPTPTPKEATGQIIQGTTEDVAGGQRTLSSIDTSGVKTYSDLQAKIKSEIPTLAKQVDAEFAKDTSGGHSIKSFERTVGEGKSAVKVNYVQQGIDDLNAIYQKTGDAQGLSNMKALENKAKINGLTYKDINDLARLHGQEINAFNANGEAASGLTKQAAENTRKGLKLTARQGLGGTEAKALDAKLSDLYDTQRLIDKQVEKVNAEAQKTSKQGIIPKVVRKAVKVIDTVTGNPLKAIGKEIGFKGENTLSASELEKNLQRNLGVIKGGTQVTTPNTMPIENLKYPYHGNETKAIGQLDNFVQQAVKDGAITAEEAIGADMSLVKYIKINYLDKGLSVPPIEVTPDGKILDGVHHFDAYKTLGLKHIPVVIKK